MSKTRTTAGALAGFIAGALLFGATGAVAATIVTSAQIKNGTIKNIDVAKGTLTADRLTAGTVASLRGKTGPAGPRGLQGLQGTQGGVGPKGDAGAGVPAEVKTWHATFTRTAGSPDDVSLSTTRVFPAGTRIEVLKISSISPATLSTSCQRSDMEPPAVRVGPGFNQVSYQSAYDDIEEGWSAEADLQSGGKLLQTAGRITLDFSCGQWGEVDPETGEVINGHEPAPSFSADVTVAIYAPQTATGSIS